MPTEQEGSCVLYSDNFRPKPQEDVRDCVPLLDRLSDNLVKCSFLYLKFQPTMTDALSVQRLMVQILTPYWKIK